MKSIITNVLTASLLLLLSPTASIADTKLEGIPTTYISKYTEKGYIKSYVEMRTEHKELESLVENHINESAEINSNQKFLKYTERRTKETLDNLLNEKTITLTNRLIYSMTN